MALIDTANISDLGKSLSQIDLEIMANENSIQNYEVLILQFKHKNTALRKLAGDLLQLVTPTLTKGN